MDFTDPHVLILGASLVIILSFVFNFFAQRSNIPSVLMLMALGFVLQPFVQVDPTALQTPLEILGTIGVILIVLEAALDLHLTRDKAPMIWKALILAAGLLLITTLIIALGIWILPGMTFFSAVVYALPLSVMSSAIIIPSVQSLDEDRKEFLTFESAFSDILGIVFFFSLTGYFKEAGEGSLILASLGNVVLSALLSIVLTYLLIILFQNVKGHVKLFLLIAILLALYAAGKLLHFSPLIMILFFGLLLNNKNLFFKGSLGYLIHDKSFDPIVKDFRIITLESAFVVRTFFFVVFGMSIIWGQLIHWSVPVITLIALAAIYAVRFGGLRLYSPQIRPELFIAPRGLITVLLFYAIPKEANSAGEMIYNEAFQPGILLLTILITSLIMTYGLIQHQRAQGPSAPAPEGQALDQAPAEPSSQEAT